MSPQRKLLILGSLYTKIVTSGTASVVVTALPLVYFCYFHLHAGGSWLPIYLISFVAILFALFVHRIMFNKMRKEGFLVPLDDADHQRVLRLVKEVSEARGGFPMPGIFTFAKLEESSSKMSRAMAINAAMVDKTFGRDYLLIGRRLLSLLTDRQLKGVIAHEMRHQNDWANVFQKLVLGIRFASSVWSVTFGALFLLSSVFGSYPFAMGIGAIAGGLGISILSAAWGTMLTAAKSRSLEYKTDIHAMLDIGDEEGLGEALEIIMKEAAALSEVDIQTAIRLRDPLLASHPLNIKRIAMLSVFSSVKYFFRFFTSARSAKPKLSE